MEANFFTDDDAFEETIAGYDFADLDDEIEKYIKGGKAQSTTYKETSDYRRFKIFLKELSSTDTREIEEIPPTELDGIFCHFFMKARKYCKTSKQYDGELYQPDSLTSFRNSFQRVLTDRGSKLDIKTSSHFERSRKVLAARRKELTKMGLGNKPNATRALSKKEFDKLTDIGNFSLDAPKPLQRYMWWMISLHFGHRARDEATKIRFGDIKLSTDDENIRYLEWDVERGSKTRTGEKCTNNYRAFNPKAFETGLSDCPVKIYELFVAVRPPAACETESPFFIQPKKKVSESDIYWFYPTPLGKNGIGKFLSEAAPLIQDPSEKQKARNKIANHSVRKSSIGWMLDEEIHPVHVTQISGHKSVEGLKSYHVSSKRKQQQMSNTLSTSSKATGSHTITHPKNNVISNPSSQNISFDMASIQETSVRTQPELNTVPSNLSMQAMSTFHGANISDCYFKIRCASDDEN